MTPSIFLCSQLARLSLKEIKKAAPNVDRIKFYHHDMLKNESNIESFMKLSVDCNEDDSQFSEVIEEDGENSDSDDVQIIEQETVIVDLDDYEETQTATEIVTKELKSLAVLTLETKTAAVMDAEDSCLHIDVPSEFQDVSTSVKTKNNGVGKGTVTTEIHEDPLEIEPKTHQEQPKIHLADLESNPEFQQVYPDFPVVSETVQPNEVIKGLPDLVASGNSEDIKLEQLTDPLSKPTVAALVEYTSTSNPESKSSDKFSQINIGNVVSLFQTFRGDEHDDSLEGIELFDFDSV